MLSSNKEIVDFLTVGSPLIRKSMISLLQSFPPSKEIDEIPYCGLSFSKEVDDFLPAGFLK